MSSTPPPEPAPGDGGTDLVTHELMDEANRLAHHPVEEARRLKDVAEEGDSPATPFLTGTAVFAVVGVVFVIVLTIALLVYYLD
jgi:hypothetical protein